MLDLGLIGFAQPWLLVALLTLPALWLLLRVTPPAPRRQLFPPLRILLRLERRDETPARTPWWLLLLRLVIAGLLILALAGPVLDPSPRVGGSGPLLLVVDDGWASGPRWRDQLAGLDRLLEQAERDEREVLLLRTAPSVPPAGLIRLPAADARRQIADWRAHPWPVDRAAALTALAGLSEQSVTPFWLTDGVADSPRARDDAAALASRLATLGPLRILTPAAAQPTSLLLLPDQSGEKLQLAALCSRAAGSERLSARAIGGGGEILGSAELVFAQGAVRAEALLDLPLDLKNRIARIELAGNHGVGGVVLLDERWRRRTVGLVGQAHGSADQPLLSELYFLERAMAPFAELRRGDVQTLLAQPLSLLVLPDTGRLSDADREQLSRWIDEGGVLLRFAGSKLAQGADDLVPVPLRVGDRQLGGALSWAEPLALAPFPPESPFAGLSPPADTRISRQVLAEPGPKLAEATLATLTDGTPLVTGRPQGRGWLVLVHTTANTSWSNLPLSGLFVDMLKRVLTLSPGIGGQTTGLLEAQLVLDADGRLREPPAGLSPVPARSLRELVPGPLHPPGLWGPIGDSGLAESERARSALNLQSGIADLLALDATTLGQGIEQLARGKEQDLGPWLLLAALLLALVDLVVGYALRGLVPALARSAAVMLLLAPVAAMTADDPALVDTANETRLAFVLTGRGDVDELSRAGLAGLSRVLADRTSVETGEPVGIVPGRDELAVYPLIYWAVPADHAELLPKALDAVQRYLRGGGMIIFDTRDASALLPGQQGGGPGERRLASLLAGIDLPPLMRVPPDHVLTKSFYLLQEFPGRWAGQPVWVDSVPAAINDGVSSVIIGGNDWAGAWAQDERGQYLLPVVPGGEQQREIARRVGVNLVMYALTGNYKTDQVHVPALLERLGQ